MTVSYFFAVGDGDFGLSDNWFDNFMGLFDF